MTQFKVGDRVHDGVFGNGVVARLPYLGCSVYKIRFDNSHIKWRTQFELTLIPPSDANSSKTNPTHYKQFSVEVCDMMLAIWGREHYIAHCEMCAFKYRMRLGSKQGESVEDDLSKARWYEAKAAELRKEQVEVDKINEKIKYYQDRLGGPIPPAQPH
jgi:hypothetical protein